MDFDGHLFKNTCFPASLSNVQRALMEMCCNSDALRGYGSMQGASAPEVLLRI